MYRYLKDIKIKKNKQKIASRVNRRKKKETFKRVNG